MERLTVIIPTRFRPDYLPVTLSSLSSQSYKNWDLILVSDPKFSLNDITEKIIKMIKLEGHNVDVISSKNNFLSNLNNAITKVKTSFTIRFDDDVYIPSNYISELMPYIKLPNVGMTGGCVLTPSGKDIYSTFCGHKGKLKVLQKPPNMDRLNTFNLGSNNSIDQKIYYRNYKFTSDKKVYFSDHLCGDGVLFKTAVLKRVKFDPELLKLSPSDVIADDLDISLGIRKLGYEIIFVPFTYVYHLHCPDYERNFNDEDVNKVFNYLKSKYSRVERN